MHKLTLILILFCAFLNAQTGKIINVKDGDTIVFLTENNKQKTVRLAGIDCPEKYQPFGNKTKEFTSNLALGKTATLKVVTIDRYNRIVAFVFIDGKNLSEELVKNGFAWHYKKYDSSVILSELENKAKQNKIGLWVDKNPTAPWEWRKNKKQ